MSITPIRLPLGKKIETEICRENEDLFGFRFGYPHVLSAIARGQERHSQSFSLFLVLLCQNDPDVRDEAEVILHSALSGLFSALQLHSAHLHKSSVPVPAWSGFLRERSPWCRSRDADSKYDPGQLRKVN